jgi:spermidine/putrescine transport system substrate-binding protein
MHARSWPRLLCGCLVMGLLSACGDAEAPKDAAQPALAKELIFYDWAEDMPQSVLDAFEAEYGVKVVNPTFGSTEEAVHSLHAGRVYDLVVMENQYIPQLSAEGLLAEIDYRNVPNFRNVSANFRDLVFDPGNRYSVTFNWGLVGLLVRDDLVPHRVERWTDLWDPRYAGRLLVWDLPRNLIGIALQSLGFSINSEDPGELEAALQRLLALRANARTSGYAPAIAEQALAGGEVMLAYGWEGDVLRARARDLDVGYVLPTEGSIQWGDNFVIPAASPRKRTAEAFIDFLLRPEISAQIVNEQHYATANEAAYPYIRPEILNDPVIFPPIADIRRAEVILPLSATGQALYEQMWQRYLAGPTHAGPSGE